jgi:hypothetical protein
MTNQFCLDFGGTPLGKDNLTQFSSILIITI